MNYKNCKSDCAEKGIDHEKQSCLGYLGNTNADKIRSMTDEELADYIAEVQLNTIKIYGNDDNDDMPLAEDLRKYLLYWLKQEE